MKRSATVVACLLSLSVLATVPSALAQADKLIGVWKTTEAKLPANPEQNLEGGTLANPQPEITVFTQKHFITVGVHSEEPRPDLPQNSTDAQLLEAWRPFTAQAGTYEVTGSTITIHTMVTKSPNLMNRKASRTRNYRFEGDVLILSYRPSSEWPAPIELKMIRLE